jgi:virginiamycin B lyase
MTVGRLFRRVAQATVMLVAFPLLGLVLTTVPASATGGVTVTQYRGTGIAGPSDIAKGADGALWFTNDDGSFSIGRITTAGTVTDFTNSSINDPGGITAGPDGALWFTNLGNEFDPGSIGRITTSGAVTNFTNPRLSEAEGITTGPDGALWFTNEGDHSIGRLTTGGTFSFFTNASITSPMAITAGPDGALWFTNGNSIGRITTTGTVTTYANPNIDVASGITVGPDGALWFTNTAFFGRITTSGVITMFTDSTVHQSFGITAGPDGGLWFTSLAEPVGGAIGRIGINGQPAIRPGTASVAEGNSGTTNLLVPVTLSIPSTLTVTAHWTTAFVTGATGNQADPATDYTPASGTVTFAPGQTAQTVAIPVIGDTLVEPDEYIVVQFSSPTNATISGNGSGTITNDDHALVVPGVASVLEGNSGTTALNVPVTLSNPSTQTITAQWTTAFAPGLPGNPADPTTDYTAASGTVTFAPGQTARSVTILVHGDTLVEPDEYIVVLFGNPTNAAIGGFYGLGFGGITNDD